MKPRSASAVMIAPERVKGTLTGAAFGAENVPADLHRQRAAARVGCDVDGQFHRPRGAEGQVFPAAGADQTVERGQRPGRRIAAGGGGGWWWRRGGLGRGRRRWPGGGRGGGGRAMARECQPSRRCRRRQSSAAASSSTEAVIRARGMSFRIIEAFPDCSGGAGGADTPIVWRLRGLCGTHRLRSCPRFCGDGAAPRTAVVRAPPRCSRRSGRSPSDSRHAASRHPGALTAAVAAARGTTAAA